MAIDPAGLSIGLAGILLAFKGIVDTINLFDLILARDNGSKHLALEYYVERHKTLIWGEEFRPDDPVASPLLHETDATKRLVAGILAEMMAVHEYAQKFVQRYDMHEPTIPQTAVGSTATGISSNIIMKMKEARDLHDQKKRFIWGTKDKEKFSAIINRMKSLNADLRDLVRSNSTQSLAAALSASLIPQLKDTLSLVALQETDTVDPLLKLSARLKQLQNDSEEQKDFDIPCYSIEKNFTLSASASDTKRPTGYFQKEDGIDKHVWIEWRIVPNDLKQADQDAITTRIRALSAMLSAARAPEFHIPPCEGLVEDTRLAANAAKKFGFIFTSPPSMSMDSTGPKSMLDLFKIYEACPPLLNERFELAYKLASAMSLMHASKWIHKGFRSDNILFFKDEHGSIALTNPYVTGFEYSRQETQISYRDRPTNDPSLDLYYHPDVPILGFNRLRDIYSLSVVLLEVAMWRPMSEMIPESCGKELNELNMSEYRAFFLDSMPQVGAQMGASYRDAVRVCLTGDFGVADEDDGSVLASAFFTKVLQKLGYCRA
jgi:hypothetical protein